MHVSTHTYVLLENTRTHMYLEKIPFSTKTRKVASG